MMLRLKKRKARVFGLGYLEIKIKKERSGLYEKRYFRKDTGRIS